MAEQARMILPGDEEPPVPPERSDDLEIQEEATEQVQEEDLEVQAHQQEVQENASTSQNKSQTLEDPMKQDDRKSPKGSRTVYCQEMETHYSLNQLIGTASGGVIKVYTAGYMPNDTEPYETMLTHDAFLAAKIIAEDQQSDAFNDLRQRVQKNGLVPYHQNILGIGNQFTDHINGNYCVVFPSMDMGSLRSIMHSKFPNGFPEKCIIVALREALKGLNFLHMNGQVHKEISAGSIFLSEVPEIKLAFSATVYDHGVDQNNPSSSAHLAPANIFRWAAAPEVFNLPNDEGYTPKADIWLIGITVLELAFGTEVRIHGRGTLLSIVKKITDEKRLMPLREVEEESQRSSSALGNLLPTRFEKWMKRMTATRLEKLVFKCLAIDPEERPTAKKLLKSKIFRRRENVTYFYDLVK